MPLEREGLGAGPGVPDPRRHRPCSRWRAVFVGGPAHRGHVIDLPLELESLGPGPGVPDPRRVVVAGGDDPVPSGVHHTDLTPPVCPLSARASAPVRASQTRAVLSAPAVAIRCRRGSSTPTSRSGVPLEREGLGSGLGVPDPRRLVPAGGGDPRAVGAPRHRAHPPGVPLEGEGLGPGPGVPDPRRLVRACGGDPLPVGGPAPSQAEVCPLRAKVSAPVLASQIRAVLSDWRWRSASRRGSTTPSGPGGVP